MVKIERQRYILFKIIKFSDIDFEQQEFLKAIWQSIWRYFGIFKAAKVGLWLIELDKEFGIIRCSHETKEIIISALTLVREIGGRRVILSPIKTSGTIRTIKKVKSLIIK